MTDLLDGLPDGLADKLRPLVRPGFVPQLEPNDPPGPVSKLAGRPWLLQGEPWPPCGRCGKPLQLLLQLDLATVPKGAPDYGAGLLQLFYCTSRTPDCAKDCQAHLPYADSVVLRRVDATLPGKTPPRDEASDALPPQAIVGWQAFDDIPDWQEIDDQSVELTDDEEMALEDAGLRATQTDKLAGWPTWTQALDYPDCPQCGETMRLVFQLCSGMSLPIAFGRGGFGHLTQCPEHRGELAFDWCVP